MNGVSRRMDGWSEREDEWMDKRGLWQWLPTLVIVICRWSSNTHLGTSAKKCCVTGYMQSELCLITTMDTL